MYSKHHGQEYLWHDAGPIPHAGKSLEHQVTEYCKVASGPAVTNVIQEIRLPSGNLPAADK